MTLTPVTAACVVGIGKLYSGLLRGLKGQAAQSSTPKQVNTGP